jgi:hypothetical protein
MLSFDSFYSLFAVNIGVIVSSSTITFPFLWLARNVEQAAQVELHVELHEKMDSIVTHVLLGTQQATRV